LIANLSPVNANVEEIVSPALKGSVVDSTHRTSSKEAQDVLDEAIRSATRAFSGLSQILPEGHPARGVALAELGKLLCVDEPLPKDAEPEGSPRSLGHSRSELSTSYPPSGPDRLKLAYSTLVRALSELTVGFGSGKNEGGEVGKTVRGLAVDVEKELNVWKEGIRHAFRDARSAGKV
jgi:SET and MYND domain-containing protein